MKIFNQSEVKIDSEIYIELYDLAPTGYFTLSREGKIIQLNISGAKMLGKNRSQLINRLFYLYISDNSKSFFLNFLEKVFDRHEKEICELILQTNDNTPMYVYITGIVSRNGSNCLITAIDITERKQAEAALLASEKKYHAIFNNTQDVFYQTDLAGIVLEVSPSIESNLGFSRDEIIGKHFSILSFDYKSKDMFFYKLKENGELRDYELRLKTKTAEFKYTSINARLVFDADGKPNHIDGAIRDITERKLAEKQIQRLSRVYSVLSNINKTIVRVRDKQFLFEEACRIAVENGGFKMAWMGMVNSVTNKVDVVASSGKTGEYVNNINIDLNDETCSSGPVGMAAKSGEYFFSNNIETDDKMIPCRKNAKKNGLRSVIALPIIVWDNTIGVYIIYSGEIDFFNEDEIKLLEELAYDISFALEFIESEKERRKTEDSLVKLKTAIDKSEISVVITDSNGNTEYANPFFTKVTGYPADEYIGKKLSVLKSGYHPKEFYEEMWNTIKSGNTWEGEFYNRKKNGEMY